MIWLLVISISLIFGFCIGIMLTRYKHQNLLYNQKSLRNELQDNKIQLHSYQQTLSNHFTHSLQLLNNIENQYRRLYQEITKTSELFLPNTDIQKELHSPSSLHIKKNNNEGKLPIQAPLDYSDHSCDATKT